MKIPALFSSFLIATSAAYSKEPVVVAPTSSVDMGTVWEFSAGAMAQDLNIQWDTQALPSLNARAFTQERHETVVGPSVELARKIGLINNTQLLLSLGWSYADTNQWESGEFLAGEGSNEIYTLDVSTFEITAQRFVLALHARTDFGGGLSVGVSAGPSLTLIDGRFEGTQEVFQETPDSSFGTFVTGAAALQSSTETAFGGMGVGYIRYTFPGDCVYLQATGGYNWSEVVRFGSTQIGAKFDGSTWAAGMSLGVKF